MMRANADNVPIDRIEEVERIGRCDSKEEYYAKTELSKAQVAAEISRNITPKREAVPQT